MNRAVKFVGKVVAGSAVLLYAGIVPTAMKAKRERGAANVQRLQFSEEIRKTAPALIGREIAPGALLRDFRYDEAQNQLLYDITIDESKNSADFPSEVKRAFWQNCRKMAPIFDVSGTVLYRYFLTSDADLGEPIFSLHFSANDCPDLCLASSMSRGGNAGSASDICRVLGDSEYKTWAAHQ